MLCSEPDLALETCQPVLQKLVRDLAHVAFAFLSKQRFHFLKEEGTAKGRPEVGPLRASGPICSHGNQYFGAVSCCKETAIATVLTGHLSHDVGSTDDRRRDVLPNGHAVLAHPVGTVGFSRGTASPGVDRETELNEFDSQPNRSRNLRPFSFSGSLTQIFLRISILARSTPTA